jgi:hypothetical protein
MHMFHWHDLLKHHVEQPCGFLMTQIGFDSDSERPSCARERSGADVSPLDPKACKWTSDEVLSVWHVFQYAHLPVHHVGEPNGSCMTRIGFD